MSGSTNIAQISMSLNKVLKLALPVGLDFSSLLIVQILIKAIIWLDLKEECHIEQTILEML